jgi:hypothetical protein
MKLKSRNRKVGPIKVIGQVFFEKGDKLQEAELDDAGADAGASEQLNEINEPCQSSKPLLLIRLRTNHLG